MSASIFRRRIIGGFGHRKFFCTAVAKLAQSSAPCLMLPPSYERRRGGECEMEYNLISLTDKGCVSFLQKGGKEEADLMRDKKTKWVGSSHGWLALFNSRNREICLLNPVSGRRVDLPPCRGEPFAAAEEYPLPYKVVISHSPDDDDCRAVMILGSLDRAAFCRPGRGGAWTPIGRWYDPDPSNKILYGDFVYSASKKSFFASFRSDSGEILGICDFEGGGAKIDVVVNAPVPESDVEEPKSTWTTYLVTEEETGQLFFVRRYLLRRKTIGSDVYRVVIDDGNGGGGRLELCSSLDDLAMFIGINHSFAVKAFDRIERDCIYFSGIWYIADQIFDMFEYGSKTWHPPSYAPSPPGKKYTVRSPAPWFVPTLD